MTHYNSADMIHFKQYLLIVTNYILLAIPWIEDLNNILKILSMVAGIILTVYLILKAIEERRVKRIERKIKEQELKNLAE